MFRSDNAAANLLMARRGGPVRLTRFMKAIGDHETRVDSYEGQVEGRPLEFDTTTPHEIVKTLRTLLLGSVISAAGRNQLEAWLAGNLIGSSRLRAAFPREWRAGDRTGTGDGYCNDLAFARRPGAAPLLVAAYYQAGGMELNRQEEVVRAVGRLVVDWQV